MSFIETVIKYSQKLWLRINRTEQEIQTFALTANKIAARVVLLAVSIGGNSRAEFSMNTNVCQNRKDKIF